MPDDSPPKQQQQLLRMGSHPEVGQPHCHVRYTRPVYSPQLQQRVTFRPMQVVPRSRRPEKRHNSFQSSHTTNASNPQTCCNLVIHLIYREGVSCLHQHLNSHKSPPFRKPFSPKASSALESAHSNLLKQKEIEKKGEKNDNELTAFTSKVPVNEDHLFEADVETKETYPGMRGQSRSLGCYVIHFSDMVFMHVSFALF